MARVTEAMTRDAVIVAHGSPSDPEPQDEAMAALAARVAALATGWRVRGATLAKEGSLDTALAGLAAPVVYPFFMAEGYFTTDVLPVRLQGHNAHPLPPFGMDPSLPALVRDAALEGALAHGFVPEDTTLLLAAHGSQVSPASKRRTCDIVRILRGSSPFQGVTAGFIEEEPLLADVARGLDHAMCLPLFTLQAGHVEGDIPQALAEAGFEGPLLAHIGAHPAVPRLIATALKREERKAAA